jgi:hypothetical protein
VTTIDLGKILVVDSKTNWGTGTDTKIDQDLYLRNALRKAVEQVAAKLQDALGGIGVTKKTDEPGPGALPTAVHLKLDDEVGVVMKVSGDTLTASLAKDAVIEDGDRLVIQAVEMMEDPATGKKIPVGETVGALIVTEVRATYLKGKFNAAGVTPGYRIVREVKDTKGTSPKATQGGGSTKKTPGPSK